MLEMVKRMMMIRRMRSSLPTRTAVIGSNSIWYSQRWNNRSRRQLL